MKNKTKRRKLEVAIGAVLIIAFIIFGIVLTGSPSRDTESIQTVMKDAVLHETNRISLFGLSVNPAVFSGFIVTGVLLICAAVVRIFVIPRFRVVPKKFQLALEMLVGYFDDLAKQNSPDRNSFLGAYVFSAGIYIFFGTVFELFGIQVIATNGNSLSLPAVLSDINAAVALGCLSYLVILIGGIITNKLRGALNTLKDFSLPISMSFRLFGALLSGLLVTELVYYSLSLSFVLPVLVGVLFTLLHALIQAYVLTMLTTIFYGEATRHSEKKHKKTKVKNIKISNNTPDIPAAEAKA